MNLTVMPGDGYVVVQPDTDSLDVTQAVAFKQQMVQVATQGEKRVVLDLSTVAFMDSSGLGAIISCMKALGRDGELVLCGAQSGVQMLLNLTRMDRVIRLFPDREAAAAALSGR
jgi:anti-sigma B factor antagonist